MPLPAGGGRLFFAGNSIARGIAHSVGASFTGIHIPRMKQKRSCLKQNLVAEAEPQESLASCSIDLLQGTPPPPNLPPLADVRFLWQEQWWNRTGPEFCGTLDPNVCWRSFFGSGPGGAHTRADVFVSNGGRWYIEEMTRRSALNMTAAIKNALADAKDFMASGVFLGPVVWLTIPTAKEGGGYGSFNGFTNAFNQGVTAGLQQLGIHVLDFHAFYSKPEDYTDQIHPWNSSYVAAVHHVLSIVC